MEKIDGVAIKRLSLFAKAEFVPIFFQLLGQGFRVNIQSGCSVKELLCNQLGIHQDYLTERIKTIFLNAKVVDDVNSATVDEGSVLALSGAMPGLVGAILRSGGIYAGMRSQISYNPIEAAPQKSATQITLKLWNLVVKELGPNFLQQGIWIEADQAQSFIERHREELMKGCTSAELDGKTVSPDQLQDIIWKDEPVFLQVVSD